MKLLRYVFAEFTPKISRVARFGSDLGDGLTVAIRELENTEEVDLGESQSPGPTLISQASADESTVAVLVATLPTQIEEVSSVELAFDENSRLRAEDGLRLFASSLAVQSQVPCRLWSPTPYLALAGDDDADRELLEQCVRIKLPKLKAFYPLAGPGLEWPLDLSSMTDRNSGVLLLGAAITASHGVAKLNELFRLFENAFAVAGTQLVDPLYGFLSTHPWNLGYTDQEVEDWVGNLRDPARHADLKRHATFAADHDVQHHLVRIEQAAYDVLFNKRSWHTTDPAREERNSLRCAITATGQIVHSEGARVRTYSGWDPHNSFPLRGRLELADAERSEWGLKLARWHFSDAERLQLKAHGAEDL
ncbi:MAG TPA: hypothetical protein VEX15_16640 [Nocardioidaceae bacterium]|nr:hypothetical protein [Nocardioidaceae bacterium]